MPAHHAREACTRVRRGASHQNGMPCGPGWCMVPLGVAGAACTPLGTRGQPCFAAALATARAVMLSTRRTVAAGVRM